ncbi:MAG: sigma factor-like helix-turn-helix DNA-binding protein [Bacillota bacterium]|nr:sigma factor-like helix-turn-helix DNA-binding protein [Bacillota bacterium]
MKEGAGVEELDLAEKALLFDTYGALLTPHQRELLEMYQDWDWTLSEVAEEKGTTRQAVHDGVKRAYGALWAFEEKLGWVQRYRERRHRLGMMAEDLQLLKEALTQEPPQVEKAKEHLLRAQRHLYTLLQE